MTEQEAVKAAAARYLESQKASAPKISPQTTAPKLLAALDIYEGLRGHWIYALRDAIFWWGSGSGQRRK